VKSPTAARNPLIKGAGTVLVTGAGGFVGREVARYLRESGVKVLGCDLGGAEQTLDVLDKEAMLQTALAFQPHAFIHAAALTSGEDLRVLEVNVQGTLNALEAAKNAGVKHFVFFSSCGVYALSSQPINESGATTTANAYALSKLLAEQAVALTKGPTTVWLLRIDAVYGASEQPSATRERTSVIHQIAAAIHTQQTLQLKRSLDDVYNWLHTSDLAQLLQTIIAHPSDGETHLYNVAGQSVSVAELVQTFQKLKPEVDLSKLLEYNPNPPPRHGAIDSSRVAQELGFSPTVRLEDGLLDYLDKRSSARGLEVRESI